MQLKDGLLKTNLGIPTMIVVNKSDVISSNNEKKRFDEDSEFILKHIRSFAINCMYLNKARCCYNNLHFFKI